MMKAVDVDYIFKILIIGDSSVGKSNLLLRFSENTFQETFLPTIGVDFKIKTLTIEGKSIKLNIWDTAGQERFKTITAAYYKGAHGILIVFDLTDKESFNHVNNWLKEIKTNTGTNLTKVLIGNKSDMEAERKIHEEEARVFAESKGMTYIETSAKTNVNVEEAFVTLTNKVYANLPDKDKVGKDDTNKIGKKRSAPKNNCNC